MKPDPPAKRRSFASPRAVAVAALSFALAWAFVSLRPQASPVPAGGTTAPTAASDRRSHRPASRRVVEPTSSIGPVAAKEGHREKTGPKVPDAFAAAAAITDPALREETLARLCYQHAESDPLGALELAIEHRLEGAAGAVIGNLAQQWASIDLPAARAWVKAQPESALREDLVARVGYVWSLEDPAAAADFVAAETPPGEAQVEAAISVLHQWSGRDPAAARSWAECFPEDELRERALHEVDGPPELGE